MSGMATTQEEQWTLPASYSLSFDERLGLLLDRELAWRDNKRLKRMRKQAELKYAGTCLEDLERLRGRCRDERQLTTLASGDWIRQQYKLLLTANRRRQNLTRLRSGQLGLSPRPQRAVLAHAALAGTTTDHPPRRQLRLHVATTGQSRRADPGWPGPDPRWKKTASTTC